jgi:hypothetical protein
MGSITTTPLAHSVERRYSGGTNEMEIESRCLDEYGKMSIESNEKKEKKNVTGTISLAQKYRS